MYFKNGFDVFCMNSVYYVNGIHYFSMALGMHVAIAVLRVPEGLDFTGIIADFDSEETVNGNRKTGIDNPHFVVSPQDSISSNATSYSMNLQSNIKEMKWRLIASFSPQASREVWTRECPNSRLMNSKVGKLDVASQLCILLRVTSLV